ncbi:hypothetical protein AMTRI_Chr06g197350 [Amborella trichopoda]
MEDKQQQQSIQDLLALPIKLAELVKKFSEEAESYRQECGEVAKRADLLAQALRQAARLTSAGGPPLYERPLRRVIEEATKNLDRALTLTKKCRRSGVLKRVFTITNVADFRKVQTRLDNSYADLKWAIDTSSSSSSSGLTLSFPPIASVDPILSWVWSYVTLVHSGGTPEDRIEGANGLASLAADSNRNGQLIIEEGGIPPLLRQLKEGPMPEAQVAAAKALVSLTSDFERVSFITAHGAVPLMVQLLWDAPTCVQTEVARLVAKMAALNLLVREDFTHEDAVRPLVSQLAAETLDDSKTLLPPHPRPNNLHNVVQSSIRVNKLQGASYSHGCRSEDEVLALYHHKEREKESPEVRAELTVQCARALWMLAQGSESNSRRIIETKGLLRLAKIIEKEQGDLQYNCLMAVMEVTSVAEWVPDLRRTAFRTNSPAASAVIEQLLRIIERCNNSQSLQIPAIRAIGSLARTFSARETFVITPLVNKLGHRNVDVATEAAIALGKFTEPCNFLCVDHSKTIIEFGGVPILIRLIKADEKAQLHGLVLLSYLAIHVAKSEALGQARALTAFELASRTVAAQHPSLKELLPKAMYQLELYQTGGHPHNEPYDL